MKRVRQHNQPLLFITIAIGILSLWSCNNKLNEKKTIPDVKHVVIIGFDGLSPDGIEKSYTPNFDKLILEGAHTFHNRAVLPTSSSSNWASMIMGAGPEQHGITSNSWEKNNFVLPAVTQSEDFLFPTIFGLINAQTPNAEIGAIYQWNGFGRLFEKNAVNYDVNPKTEDETAEVASKYIMDKNPTFTFIHFDHVDHAGHEFGHGSPEYYQSVEKADTLLAQVMNAIKKAGIADETLVIISADHGGVGLGHGGESLKEIEIPFIVWGKSVKKNYTIKYPVYQYDNAATVAFALGVKQPVAWIGKPVKTAFEGYEETDNFTITEMFKEPSILPKALLNKKPGGLFDEATFVVIENPNQEGEIHYTLDGSMPSKEAKKYVDSFKISQNTVVKSAIFKNGKISSTVNEAYFRIKGGNDIRPVSYEVFYLNNLNTVPVLENKKPDAKGTSFEITSDEIKEEIKNNTVVRFKTTIVIDKDDKYGFHTRSDDGSKLWVNNELVVDNDGDHGVKEKVGGITLKKGTYPLEVVWFNGGGGSWLDVYYQTDTMPKQIIPTTVLKLNNN